MCNGKIECWWVGKECIKLIPGSAMQRYALYNARIRTMQCKDAQFTMPGCAVRCKDTQCRLKLITTFSQLSSPRFNSTPESATCKPSQF